MPYISEAQLEEYRANTVYYSEYRDRYIDLKGRMLEIRGHLDYLMSHEYYDTDYYAHLQAIEKLITGEK